MPPLKWLAEREEAEPRFTGGHALCRGCGIPAVVRTVLASIPGPVVVVTATGCLEVSTTRWPVTAWRVPWLHVAFENAAAAASGVEAAARALGREDVTVVVFAGDGGTYDIGLQALSGAMERGHRMVYVCYDNEAYMNTGIQRSGATPFGAATTTSPVGRAQRGKQQGRKPLTEIVAAHWVPYVAQAAISHLQDLSDKAARAAAAGGPAFLNVLTACPPGWGHEPRETFQAVRLAVDTGYWPLYEVVEGHWRLTYRPPRRERLEAWLALQGRFRHLLGPEAEGELEELRRQVDEDFARILRRDEADRAWFSGRPQIPEVAPSLVAFPAGRLS